MTPGAGSGEGGMGSGEGGTGTAGGAAAGRSACDLVEALAAELALGTLPGSERALALSHLEQCASCREVVENLGRAADALLLTAKAVDPPLGFEVRLLDRLEDMSTAPARDQLPALRRGARISRRWTLGIAAAAALIAVGAGVGIGVAVVGPTGGPAQVSARAGGRTGDHLLETAVLRPPQPGAARGEVAMAGGPRGILLMTVKDLGPYAWVECQIVVRGRAVTAGQFDTYGGAGSWTVHLPTSVRRSEVSMVRVVSPDGLVLAVASFG